jgi:hypothetical protein
MGDALGIARVLQVQITSFKRVDLGPGYYAEHQFFEPHISAYPDEVFDD